MSGITTTSSIARELEEGINAITNQNYSQLPKEYEKILDVQTSKKAYETDVPLAGTGFATTKPEGQGIAYDNMQEGASKRYLNVTYALGGIITEEAIDDNLYLPMIGKIGKMLANSINHTKEQVAANVFNNGYNSGFVGWDGQPLFSDSHSLIKGGTYSNVLAVASDLNEASLEDAMIAIAAFRDDAGLILNVRAKSLHIASANQFNAQRILGSTLQNDTDNNALNAIKSLGMLSGGFHVNHRFEDPENWFLRTDVEDGGKMFIREDMKTGMDNDFGTGNYRHKAQTRFSVGFTDSRQYFGSGNIV